MVEKQQLILHTYSDMLINANDRVIRYFRVDEQTGIPKLQNKFQDLVNRITVESILSKRRW